MFLVRSETHTLQVWSIEMAMPVPYGYGRRPLSSSDSYQRGQLFLSPYGGYHKAAPFGCGCLLGECYSKVGATIDSISKKTNSKICTFLKQLLLNWTDLPISHFVAVPSWTVAFLNKLDHSSFKLSAKYCHNYCRNI